MVRRGASRFDGATSDCINDARCHRRHRRGAFALMDVLVAGILVSVALVAILGLSSQALRAQIRGEQQQKAAMLLDELLNEVLMMGPEVYKDQAPSDRRLHPDYTDFSYFVDVAEPARQGDPFTVTARVWLESAGYGTEVPYTVQTYVAPRLGEEPDPEREPENVIERDE